MTTEEQREMLRAFNQVADRFMVPDNARPGEWKCRLCAGETMVDGPVIHTPERALTVLYQALEAPHD